MGTSRDCYGFPFLKPFLFPGESFEKEREEREREREKERERETLAHIERIFLYLERQEVDFIHVLPH